MSDALQIVVDTATKAFATTFGSAQLHAASHGEWLADGWAMIENLGLPFALVPEEAGGFGLEIDEALGLVGIAAAHAVPLPLPETMFANHLLARAGIEARSGVMAVSEGQLSVSRSAGGWRILGVSGVVPWPSKLSAVALVIRDEGLTRIARVPAEQFRASEIITALTGQPCGRVHVDAIVPDADVAVLPSDLPVNVALRGGAALRAIGMAGAIQKIVEITAGYVSERVQFGRTLSKFQVVQHDIARMAGQAAAAHAAAGLAAAAFADFDLVRIAAAKARAGEAAGIVAGLAHQLHGAIGVTEEYRLHYLTRQLWAWRDEFGSEAAWNEKLGRAAMRKGGDGLWAWLTAI